MKIKSSVPVLGLIIVLSSCSWLGAQPIPESDNSAQIIRYENMQADDNYTFDFLTSDGQKREETGFLVNGGKELVVFGSYSYTGPDNRVYLVEYVADRNGYKPHLTIKDNVEDDQPPPQISTAGIAPETGIRPHALKSLLG